MCVYLMSVYILYLDLAEWAISMEKMEPWAKTLSELWHSRTWDFAAEQRFNLASSLREPHCAICSLFKPFEV